MKRGNAVTSQTGYLSKGIQSLYKEFFSIEFLAYFANVGATSMKLTRLKVRSFNMKGAVFKLVNYSEQLP